MKISALLSLTFVLSASAFAEGPTNSSNEVQKIEAGTPKMPPEVKAEPAKSESASTSEKTACKEESSVKCSADKAWESTKEAGKDVGEVAKSAASVALQGTAKVADKVTGGLEKAAETLKHTAEKLEGKDDAK